MEFFRIRQDIPFMRYALVLNAISLITFLAAVFFLAYKGLHLSIEFTGGTVLEVKYSQTTELEPIRSAISKLGYTDVNVQNFGSSKDVMVRLPLIKNPDGSLMSSAQQSQSLMQELSKLDPSASLQRVEFLGAEALAHLRLVGHDGTLIARLAPQAAAAFQAGETLFIALRQDRILAFGAGGARVARMVGASVHPGRHAA